MKRILKWAALAIVSIVVVALIAIYGVSEYQLRRRFDIAAAPVTITSDSATLARGRHVYITRGCQGCHGPGMTGKVFFDEPMLARLVASQRCKHDRDEQREERHQCEMTGHLRPCAISNASRTTSMLSRPATIMNALPYS